MPLRKITFQQLIFSIHFVFEIEVNYPQHEVLNFCQQELLNSLLVE